MAGRTLRFLEQALPPAAMIRAMPNTPAAIGRGITVAVPNARVSVPQRALVDALLSAVGKVEWIDDEALMDAVTALSGSGPAYVFLLAEAMARAGAAAGLPTDLAETLARATVAGSGELLRPLAARRGDLAAECHFARRHDRGCARRADGQGWAGAPHGRSRSRRRPRRSRELAG